MKRTPLRRGKRIPWKREEPRWNQNESLRVDYRETHGSCMLKGIWTPRGGHSDALHVHHLLRLRVDVWECFLMVCWVCHTWGHEHDRDFNALTLLAKFRAKELDMDVLSKLKGKRVEWYLQPLPGMSPPALSAIEELKHGGIYW